MTLDEIHQHLARSERDAGLLDELIAAERAEASAAERERCLTILRGYLGEPGWFARQHMPDPMPAQRCVDTVNTILQLAIDNIGAGG